MIGWSGDHNYGWSWGLQEGKTPGTVLVSAALEVQLKNA